MSENALNTGGAVLYKSKKLVLLYQKAGDGLQKSITYPNSHIINALSRKVMLYIKFIFFKKWYFCVSSRHFTYKQLIHEIRRQL